MARFTDRVVVITGGARGIGLAIAEAFSQAGATVVVLDLKMPAELDASWFFYSCDVSSENSVQQTFAAIKQQFGAIDFLVNNAGIQAYGSVTETSFDEWQKVLNINLTGQFLCARAAIPLMKEGVIVNMASTAALATQSKTASYTTAKSALLGLTRSIALDYAPNIRCVAVCPGTIDTPLMQEVLRDSSNPEELLAECKNMHALKRIGKPSEVADMVMFLCSDEASFVTGHYYRVDGGQGIDIPGSQR